MTFKLISTETGREIKIGDTVSSGTTTTGILEFFRPPHKPSSSSGRVYVRTPDSRWMNEWYPSVIDARIVREEEALAVGVNIILRRIAPELSSKSQEMMPGHHGVTVCLSDGRVLFFGQADDAWGADVLEQVDGALVFTGRSLETTIPLTETDPERIAQGILDAVRSRQGQEDAADA